MQIKIHKSYRNVISLCDSELIGKKFEQDKRQLDINERFYGGDKISRDEAIKILNQQKNEDATFNIVGEKSITVAIETGIITHEHVGKVDNIPFALTLL